jgi:AFG3 family protein
VVNFYLTGSKGPVETTWNKVRTTMLASSDIDRMVVINKEKAHIYLKADRVNKYEKEMEGTFTKPSEMGPHFYFVIGSIETFERNLSEAQETMEESQRIEPEYRNERNWMGELLWTIGPFVLIILLWLWIFRRMSKGGGGGAGGIFSVGKSQAKVFDKDAKVSTTFKDVAGLSEAKQEVVEIVEFLRNPGKVYPSGG